MAYLFKVSHLSKRYKGEDKFVLDDLSFSFPDHGFIAIIGKSGCGKSTLLHLLLGLLKPSKGKIFYKKKNMAEYSKTEWLQFRRHESSIVHQHYNLIDESSALSNVMLPLLISGQSRIKAKKQSLDLLKRFHLEHLADKKVRLLSGGEKQRIAICRSLVTSPSVIFCDEPTGALDSDNAKVVMDMLLSISKTSLVVFVTHNIELAQRYSDRMILLKNGKIEQDRLIRSIPAKIDQKETRKSIRQGIWIGSFLKRNLNRHPVMVNVRIVSSFIGFVSILLCVGFAYGNAPALESVKQNTLDYCTLTLARKDYVEVPSSPLRLIKQSRPSLEEAEELLEDSSSSSIHLDYSYFFPPSLPFSFDDERKEPCRFCPLYDITLKEFGSNLLRTFDESFSVLDNACYVNQEFKEQYDIGEGNIIRVSYESILAYEGHKETVLTEFEFYIAGVIEEFGFLNSPKIYYSYPMLERFYGDYELEDFPLRNGRKETVSSLLASLPGDINYTNYGYLVFTHAIDEANHLFQMIEAQEDDGLLLHSDAYDIATSFSSLAEALLACLILFIIISIVSLALIIALNAYSSFLSQKKQSAILLSLGAKHSDIVSLVSLEGVALSLVAVLLALPTSILGEKLLSRILENQFGIPNLIQIPFASLWGVPYLLLPLIIIVALLIPVISSIIPLSFAGRIDLAEALKEE